MIFRTITNESTGATKSIGLFGKNIDEIGKSLSSIKTNGLFNSFFNISTIDEVAITNYNKEIKKATANGATMAKKQQIMKTAMEGTNKATTQLIGSTKGAIVETDALTDAQHSSTLAARAQAVALKAASIAGNMILFTVITKGIELAATALDNYIHRVERARERTDELFSKFKDMNDTLADHKKVVSESADRYDELSKGVNLSNNENRSLSSDEYQEFLNINEQLAQSFPELVNGIDENGNSILSLGENGTTAKEQLKELLQTEEDLNNFKIAQDIDDAFAGVYTYVEEATEAAEKLNSSLANTNEEIGLLRDFVENGINLNQDSYKLFSGDITDKTITDYAYAMQTSAQDFFNGLNSDRKNELNTKGIDGSNLFTIETNEFTGAFDFYANLYSLTPDEISDLEGLIADNVASINGTLLDAINDQSQECQNKIQQGENAWRDFIPGLVATMKSKQTFQDLDDDLQNIAVQIVEGLDYSYASAMKEWNPTDPYAYIRDNLIVPMGDLSDSDKQKLQSSFDNLIKLDAGNLSQQNQAEITQLINTIASLLEKTPLEIRVALGFDVEDTKNKYNEALKEAKRQLGGYEHDDKGFEVNNTVGYDLDNFWAENVVTEEDCALWKEVTDGITDAAEAMDTYTEAKKNTNAVEVNDTPVSLSVSDTIDQLNTQLKPSFDSLKSAYQDIFIDDGFTLENVDTSMLSSIKSTIDELNSMEGVDINVDYSSFENLAKVLTDTSSTSDKVIKAFNSLATEIINSTSATAGMTDETKNMVTQLLESLGVTNAEEVVMYALSEAKAEAFLASYDLENATQDEIVAMLAEAEAAGITTDMIFKLVAEEQVFNNQGLSAEDKVKELKKLADAYGQTAVAAKISRMEDEYTNSHQPINYEEIAKAAQAEINNAVNSVHVDFSGIDKDARAASQAAKEEVNVLSDLNSEMDKLQSAYKSLCDIKDTYNKYGKITVDQYQELTDLGFNFLANLVDENGQLGLNASAFERLAQAKLEEMQIQMARNATDTINGLKTEAAAVEYLTYATEQNRQAALGAAEAELQWAVAAARRRGEQQGLAAEQIYQGYQASKQLAGSVDLFFDPSAQEKENSREDNANKLLDAYNKEKALLEHMLALDQISKAEYYDRLMKLVHQYFDGDEEHQDQIWDVEEGYHDYLESIKETYNWIEIFLENLARKADALIDKAGKFITWSKKNAMINRAVKATDKQITGQTNAYAYYAEKARKVGLNNAYIDKIQNGTLTMEDMQNESLSDKIEKYQEWYDKMVACEDAISELYDQERDLLKQKLDNVLEYYNDLDSYMSSIVSKMDSFISLMDDMGKRSSLTDLLEQFAAANEQIAYFQSKTTTTKEENEKNYFDSSKKVEAAKKEDSDRLLSSLESEKEQVNTGVRNTGTYKKLLNDIAKAELAVQKQEAVMDKIDISKSGGEKKWDAAQKKWDQLESKRADLVMKKEWLEQNATANNVVAYAKKIDEYIKLTNKQIALADKGKELSAKEQERLEALQEEFNAIDAEKNNLVKDLEDQIGLLSGTKKGATEAENIRKQIEELKHGVLNSATYQNIEKDIEAVQAKIDKFWDTHDSATSSQQKQLDQWQAQLEAYYEKQRQLEENATADTVGEYAKVYDAWRKLQDKLDAGKVLSVNEYKNYNKYNEQLKQFAEERSSILKSLEDQLEKALNPGDKVANINREYEEAAEGIYKSYQDQIDNIDARMKASKQYQDLLAKKQNLENIRDTKGLSASQEKTLKKYTEELEALEKGGTGDNITNYIKAWEQWYALQQKIDSGKKLSASEASKYDSLKSQLEAWNKDKQTQISDLIDLMNDDLEKLRKTNAENIADAESEVNSYYSKVYELARQIAEYNISTLKEQLAYLDAYISYYQSLVSLYDQFSGDKLSRLLNDLDEGTLHDQIQVYEKYLAALQSKYDATLSEINEYKQLIDAIDTNDFSASMDLFRKAMDEYKASGNTEMAARLQSVLDLLNERAVDADNWDEYADLWLNEWEQALAEAKSGLIETAGSIQEINDALREVRFSNITDALDELTRASNILSSMSGLIQDSWLYEGDGLSEYGKAKAALLVSQLENAQGAANEYLELIKKIQDNEDTYASDKAYQDALAEATQNYYDSLSNAADIENTIVDIMKKTQEEEVSNWKNIISARKEALSAKKSYYDYDRSVKDKNKNIEALKAELAALNEVATAEAKAHKAKLKAQLEEAETDLADTKIEHEYDLQVKALDDWANTLEEALNDSNQTVEESLESQKKIIEEAKELYRTSTDSVNKTMDKIVNFYSGMGELIPLAPIDLDEEMFQMMSYRIAPELQNLVDSVQRLENYQINNHQPVEINVHYDTLLNIEGNVDEAAAKLLPAQLEQSFDYTTKKLYHQMIRVGAKNLN